MLSRLNKAIVSLGSGLAVFFVLCCNLAEIQAQPPYVINSDEMLEFDSSTIFCQNGLVDGSGKMYGLLVGVNQPNDDFTELKGPSEEIKNLARFLKKQQYIVKTLVNEAATKPAILSWLAAIMSKTNSEDRILFYYTGHASTLKDLAGNLDPNLQLKSQDTLATTFFLLPYQKQEQDLKEIISMREIVELLNLKQDSSFIRQRVLILDACYGGYFVNVSPLTCNMFDNEMPPDGFYALTSLKAEIYDGQYGPIILEGLRGGADCILSGNENGIVSLFELTPYLEHEVKRKFGVPRGEKYSSRYIFVGSGEVALTLAK